MDDDCIPKHDSVALRESRGPWRANARQRFITSRRLEDWLISDWEHKRRHMQLPDLDFEPVRSGLFYSLRLGGTWVAADWWLQYFELDERVTALRLEALHDDLNRLLLPLLPEGTTPFQSPPKENARPTKPAQQPAFSSIGLHVHLRTPMGRMAEEGLWSRRQTVDRCVDPGGGDAPQWHVSGFLQALDVPPGLSSPVMTTILLAISNDPTSQLCRASYRFAAMVAQPSRHLAFASGLVAHSASTACGCMPQTPA